MLKLITDITLYHRLLLKFTTNVFTEIWPGRTTGLNLRSKYSRYKGNQDLYHRDMAAKRSYYNEVAPDRAAETSSKSAMVEKSYTCCEQGSIKSKIGWELTKNDCHVSLGL